MQDPSMLGMFLAIPVVFVILIIGIICISRCNKSPAALVTGLQDTTSQINRKSNSFLNLSPSENPLISRTTPSMSVTSYSVGNTSDVGDDVISCSNVYEKTPDMVQVSKHDLEDADITTEPDNKSELVSDYENKNAALSNLPTVYGCDLIDGTGYQRRNPLDRQPSLGQPHPLKFNTLPHKPRSISSTEKSNYGVDSSLYSFSSQYRFNFDSPILVEPQSPSPIPSNSLVKSSYNNTGTPMSNNFNSLRFPKPRTNYIVRRPGVGHGEESFV